MFPDGTHTHKATLLVPLLQLTSPLGPLMQLYRLPRLHGELFGAKVPTVQ